MRSEPLDAYFKRTGMRPELKWPHTACWRGYVGTWEIIDERLYLVGFEGWRPDDTKMTLENLFPGSGGKVLAHWFSGKVEVPSGELLQYIHLGHASVYESSIIFKFRKGVLLSRRVRNNSHHLPSVLMRAIWARL